MHRALALALATLTLLAGCVGKDPEPKLPPSDRDGGDVDLSNARRDDDPRYDPPLENGSEAERAGVSTIPLVLDGNVGSGATFCVFGPVPGQCSFVPVEEGNSGVILEGLAGWIESGEIVLTWEAEAPATEELAAGLMLMDGGDGCEGMQLAGGHGASPLTLTVEKAPRPLCSGEVVHLWVSGNTYAYQPPAYYQVDVDQAFHAEGAFLLATVPDA